MAPFLASLKLATLAQVSQGHSSNQNPYGRFNGSAAVRFSPSAAESEDFFFFSPHSFFPVGNPGGKVLKFSEWKWLKREFAECLSDVSPVQRR